MAIQSLKRTLFNLCLEQQNRKIENFRKAMEEAQQAANSEERSTAGDKYDTSRAMNQNARDMNARHLQEALTELDALQKINPDLRTEEVKTGSVVLTDGGNYFISISAGQIKTEQGVFFAISPNAPIAQAMLHKKQGERFSFRNQSVEIKEIL